MNDIPVIHADIGDGKRRRFFLGADELRIVKREAGRGFYSLYSTFFETAEPHEVSAVVRLALIGGGEPPPAASELVDYYCAPPRSLEHAYILAFQCLEAAWKGSEQKRGGRRPSVEEMDRFFDTVEAELLRKGLDTSVIRGKSFAEVATLLNELNKDTEKPEVPDAETFEAIKATAKKRARK